MVISQAWTLGLVFTTGLLSGCGIGYVLVKRKSKALHHSYQHLQKDLTQTQQAYESFQQNVSQHFLETAQLFNQLNDNYRAIHEHVANGAAELCRTEKSILFPESEPLMSLDDMHKTHKSMAPRDYFNEPHPLREASS